MENFKKQFTFLIAMEQNSKPCVYIFLHKIHTKNRVECGIF
jgi:hypothetical protein